MSLALRRIALVALLLSGVPGPGPLAAAAGDETGSLPREASAEARLEQAVAAYGDAQDRADRSLRVAGFRRAARLFEAAVAAAGGMREGRASAALYTSWGNAALQAEELGQAVLAYRRALLLEPDDRKALQNLDHARSLLPGWVPRPESDSLLASFFFWHRILPRAERERFAAVAFALAALLLSASIRFRLPSLRTASVLPALAWLALVASVALDPAASARDEAVVTVPEAVARAADSRLAPSAFPEPLPGGVELRVLERRPPWLRVRLANGRDAWLSASSVTPVLE